MAVITISKNQTLYEAEHPVSQLYLILKGSFSVSFPGGAYIIGKGEVCGICDLCMDIHSTSCKALEDSSLLVCSVSDIDSLNALFKTSPDYSMIFLRSAFRQINNLIQQLEVVQFYCSDLYTNCIQEYEFYQSCCLRHQLRPRILSEISELSSYNEDCSLEPWAPSYYDGFHQILSDNGLSVIAKDNSVPTGLIAGACMDITKIMASLKALSEYQKQILHVLINEDLEDLFDIYSSLYLKLGSNSSDSGKIYHTINHFMELVTNSPYIDKAVFTQRFTDFKNSINLLPTKNNGDEHTSKQKHTGLALLTGSLQTILSYAVADEDFCSMFKKLITKYRAESDKNAIDDNSRSLRLHITKQFYELYKLVFFQAIRDNDIPLPVRMFLYFGYVDEQLAGEDNAIYLSHMAELLSGEAHEHIYTIYDWLLAIYKGKKEPSRNEFDVDYTEYIHSLKVTGKITGKEEATLAHDMRKKVEYELQNMFPVVNKMTYGRISTFCPVFSEHNVLKQLDMSMVSVNALQEALKNVIDQDYSVFYREYVYSNVPVGIQKEYFHMEVMPDILLTPCVGTRSVMWQEIEGRKRTTSARMMLPIIYLENLDTAVARLAGEYRWEMCKRVQGARWNDISDRSLTSEYFDYIQFYKKNHELSSETREKLKSSLQKARNSFKEMFVRDYITYISFEGTGSPRLTKPARTILFTYCPFSAKVREPLMNNPIYKEILDYYLIKKNQQLHRLDLLTKRVEKAGYPVPKELADEKSFTEC
ncbi:MAG TPA: cyclic nucleotide-binding domain-containing protein [Lachnospiraceae bacterium]|nr:cyclic nucleotide-binding domain-containing protein [Lachnospiraceae bacterium]